MANSVAELISDTLYYADLSSAVRSEYLTIARELVRRQHAANPSLWARERLRFDLRPLQRAMLESVRDKSQTALRQLAPAEGSALSALAAAWWVDTGSPGSSLVLFCTADAARLASFWHALEELQTRGRLAGRIVPNGWQVSAPGRSRTLAAIGCVADALASLEEELRPRMRSTLYIADAVAPAPLAAARSLSLNSPVPLATSWTVANSQALELAQP